MTLTIHVPAIETVEAPLEAELVLGGGAAAGDSVSRRVSVGVPVVRRITTADAADDLELLHFLEQGRHRYYLISLACGFAPDSGDVVESATVSLDLACDDGTALAWSLAPLRLSQRVVHSEVSAGMDVTLGPLLALHGSWAPPTEQEKCYVYALGEREPDPEWRYRSTSPEILNGSHRMTAVIQCGAVSAVTGTVEVSARLRHSKFGLVRTVASVPPAARTFALT